MAENLRLYSSLIPLAVVTLLLLGGVLLAGNARPSSTQVLGEQTASNQQGEQARDSAGGDKPEAKETPEPKEVEQEKEAENIQHEVENEVAQGKVDKVEVHPTSKKPDEGTLKLERSDGTISEKAAPVSKTSLISVQDQQAGAVQVSVGKDGTVTLINGGITVKTSFPVVIDPKSQSVGIKTPSGVTVISTLPSQALDKLQSSDKPTVIQSAVLGEQNGQVYYDVSGIQKRKFIGLFPVDASVETKINAQNGVVLSSNKPWYLSFFGFLYTV